MLHDVLKKNLLKFFVVSCNFIDTLNICQIFFICQSIHEVSFDSFERSQPVMEHKQHKFLNMLENEQNGKLWFKIINTW